MYAFITTENSKYKTISVCPICNSSEINLMIKNRVISDPMMWCGCGVKCFLKCNVKNMEELKSNYISSFYISGGENDPEERFDRKSFDKKDIFMKQYQIDNINNELKLLSNKLMENMLNSEDTIVYQIPLVKIMRVYDQYTFKNVRLRLTEKEETEYSDMSFEDAIVHEKFGPLLKKYSYKEHKYIIRGYMTTLAPAYCLTEDNVIRSFG